MQVDFFFTRFFYFFYSRQTRDELKDAIEKEIGEYSRECDFFSHSRREDEDDGGVSSADYDEMEPVEEAEAADTALEARENGDDDTDATVASNGNLDGPSKKSVSPTSPFELQVSRLLAQVNEVSWNHAEFRVRYHSLAAEPRVGNYFLRLLLEEDKRLASVSADAGADASVLGLSRIKNRTELCEDAVSVSLMLSGSFLQRPSDNLI
ncbi:unnamed protein product [Hydatigera taeniaeformis]|uniref:RME-8_N domain-containing protein n=1 Tax=Hydatigena taeniaeformis TaxID=6205 RepID=A0A0R3WX14_HYDTA|nr:unnamed protein product [Hydatigera taeniaeformis]